MVKNKTFDLIIFGLAGLLIIVAGAVWYYYNGLNQQIQQKITYQRMELANAEAKIKLLNELKAREKELQEKKLWLTTFIPNDEGQAQFIGELQNLADKCDIDIESCILDPLPKPLKVLPQYNIYQWKVKFNGDYPGFISFLNELPVSQRCVNVSEMKLSTNKSNSNDRTGAKMGMECSLDIVTIAPIAPNAPAEKVNK